MRRSSGSLNINIYWKKIFSFNFKPVEPIEIFASSHSSLQRRLKWFRAAFRPAAFSLGSRQNRTVSQKRGRIRWRVYSWKYLIYVWFFKDYVLDKVVFLKKCIVLSCKTLQHRYLILLKQKKKNPTLPVVRGEKSARKRLGWSTRRAPRNPLKFVFIMFFKWFSLVLLSYRSAFW